MILWEGEGNFNLINFYFWWCFYKMFCLMIFYVGLFFGLLCIYLEMGRNLGWVVLCNCFCGEGFIGDKIRDEKLYCVL